MTRSIPAKEAAKMLREGLKNEFPGVKFSVTMGRGTAAAWLEIHYTDGPPETAVRQFAFRYQGAQFNGMTDGYDRVENRLIAFEGQDVPEEVHFQVDGINESRAHSPAAWLHAQAIITAAGYPDIQVCTADGKPINEGPVPEWVAIDGKQYTHLYSPAGLARSVPARATSPPSPATTRSTRPCTNDSPHAPTTRASTEWRTSAERWPSPRRAPSATSRPTTNPLPAGPRGPAGEGHPLHSPAAQYQSDIRIGAP